MTSQRFTLEFALAFGDRGVEVSAADMRPAVKVAIEATPNRARKSAREYLLFGMRLEIIRGWICVLVIALLKRRSVQIELVEHSFVAHDVDVSLFIRAKRRNALWTSANLPHRVQHAPEVVILRSLAHAA